MKNMTVSMCELAGILRTHAARYPRMEPTDAVKLIYQNEFGGGHLIQDRERFMDYLRREYASVQKKAEITKYEDIGNGIVRVNLAALSESELDPLGVVFIQSAKLQTGSMECFLAKLALLEQLTKEGVFSFGYESLRQYLDEYMQQGYPAVSHSKAYRAAYNSAYRIVLRTLIDQ